MTRDILFRERAQRASEIIIRESPRCIKSLYARLIPNFIFFDNIFGERSSTLHRELFDWNHGGSSHVGKASFMKSENFCLAIVPGSGKIITNNLNKHTDPARVHRRKNRSFVYLFVRSVVRSFVFVFVCLLHITTSLSFLHLYCFVVYCFVLRKFCDSIVIIVHLNRVYIVCTFYFRK